MNLRNKTLLAVSTTLVGLLVLLYVVVSFVLVSGFNRVENRDGRGNVERVLNAVGAQENALSRLGYDWSQWDASFRFVRGGNAAFDAAFRQSNLNEGSIASIRVDLMMFVQPGGHVVFGTGLDEGKGVLTPVPAGMEQLLAPKGMLLRDPLGGKPVKGLVVLSGRVMMVVAQPIVPSNGLGYGDGVLILGQYLDQRRVAALESQTKFPLSLYPATALPAELAPVAASLSSTAPVLLRALSPTVMEGYGMLPDIFGRPAALLRIRMDRPVHQVALVSLHYLLLALAAAGIVFLVLTLVLLERLVLARLARLSSGVGEVRAARDLDMRLTLPGRDELARLAEDINAMLQALKDSGDREQQLRLEVEELRIEIDQAKKTRQVAEITGTDYFKRLRERAAGLRQRMAAEGADPVPSGSP